MYTVMENHILVTGKGWYNQPICNRIELRRGDLENVKSAIDSGQDTREAVENWLDCHSGDFQSIKDFSAILDNLGIIIPFENEESELDFCFDF